MASSTPIPVGIDLGTTYSCIGVYQNGKVKTISDDLGTSVIPSCVTFTRTGHAVGSTAHNKSSLNLPYTVYEVKRMMGKSHNDPELARYASKWPFNIVNNGGKPKISVSPEGQDRQFSPEEVSALILKHLKDIAEQYLEETITEVVISVPANFNDSQRKATEAAAQIAGLKVLRIVNEPTAAALAYTHTREVTNDRNILVYDLGGGTFDVTVMAQEGDGMYNMYKVIATKGDMNLGGSDFDARMSEYMFAEKIDKKIVDGMNQENRRIFNARVTRKCEELKCMLSGVIDPNQPIINHLDPQANVSLDLSITKSKFEELNDAFFRKTISIVEETLTDAGISRDDIHDVVLVGGSSKIDKIRTLLQDFFPRVDISFSVDPDESIAIGATIYANMLIDPDDAMQPLLLDVTPLSLGVSAVLGGTPGRMDIIIPHNSHIPSSAKKTYTTMKDNQNSIYVKVYQGEHDLVSNNHFLGSIILDEIPPRPKGADRIDIIFELNENGTLDVITSIQNERPRVLSIQNEQRRLPPEEVERLSSIYQDFQP